jgi:transposase
MPAPYSEDLRERVIRLYGKGGMAYEEIADLLGIGRATVSRYLRLHRENGSVAPKPATGGVSARLEGEPRTELAALVEAYPDKTIAELNGLWTDRHPDLVVSVRTLSREVRAAGFTRKKRHSGRRRSSGRK